MPDEPLPQPSGRPRFWSRVAPALLLLVLSPLIAEFLLGDFTVRSLPILAILLPLYGGGALLIREVTRRTGRGWPTMVLLAIAYGIFEEGVTTMSLFNPDYAGQHLLRYGFVPALGTSFNWDLFVVAIHVVFSMSTPILIAEGVAGHRRTRPWLGKPGLAVTVALFLAGAAVTTGFQIASSGFVASPGQLVTVAVLMALLVAAAFTAFRRAATPAAPATPDRRVVWLAFPLVLVLLSTFEVVRRLVTGPTTPAWLPVVLMLVLLAATGAVPLLWSRRPGWAPSGCLAFAAGAVGTYSWLSISTFLAGRTDLGTPTGPVDVAGQVLLALCLFGVILLAAVRGAPGGSGSAQSGPAAEAAGAR